MPLGAPAAAAAPSPDSGDDTSDWGGNIQYLINISVAGAATCVLIFLLVKLRFDHRRIPGPSALAAKLRAVYYATAAQIAVHCGADAAQFLLFERASFAVLAAAAVAALAAALPLNLFAGVNPVADQFTATTISHVPQGSPVLWLHLLLAVSIAAAAHLGISRLEDQLRITRFRDGNGNPSDPNSSSVAVFTVMIQGIPKTLAADKAALEDYFQHRYPDKVYRIVIPFDLCSLDYFVEEWGLVQSKISLLQARMNAHELFGDQDQMARASDHWLLIKCRELWALTAQKLRFTDEDQLQRLQNRKQVLQSKLLDYKEGKAPGAGVAFVIFKDVYTANRAVRDLRNERRAEAPIGRFFPLAELQLEQTRWTVERAPPASDIYWNHLGLSKISLRLRRIAVNTCLLLMLLFFSSPLAIVSAMQSAGRIINAEAMDHAKSWFDWLQGSSWFWSIIFQFLPNNLIFMSMYIIIPSVLSYFSRFECHLTVSGEQRAALLKMVCFFLVNLIVLRSLVESSLESWILKMGKCYLDGGNCKRIDQYLSPSFLSRSSLSTLAFLITSTFIGISVDLLTPVPVIKNILKKFRKNDMVQLVPEEQEEYPLVPNGQDSNGSMRAPLIIARDDSVGPNGIEGQDLSIYPLNRTFHMPKKQFDFAQYYAFDLTIFALTMIYSLFAPLVVPVGAIYFGYRYIVDKYNFLFVFRVRGYPAGNDGKLMDMVLFIMQFCVIFFLGAMLLFFAVQGDSLKLQAIITLGLLVFYKLLPSKADISQPALLQGFQTVDSFVDGPTDYEVFSQPSVDWNIYEL